MKRVRFSVEQAKEVGFDKVEKKALRILRKDFTGNWRKAEVIANVDGDQLIFVLVDPEHKD